MIKIRFTRDYRGPATGENFFETGQEWCFDDSAAMQIVGENAGEVLELDVLPVSPEGQPADQNPVQPELVMDAPEKLEAPAKKKTSSKKKPIGAAPAPTDPVETAQSDPTAGTDPAETVQPEAPAQTDSTETPQPDPAG